MNLYTANAQYVSRPEDERYDSPDALIAASLQDAEHSAERTYNLKDLEVRPARRNVPLSVGYANTVELVSPKGGAELTHWAFGQLSRSVGAPAGYLRTLPAELVADNLNFGLKSSPVGTTAQLYVRGANGAPPLVRACTTETYGRLLDATLYSAARDRVFNLRSTGTGDGWTAPKSWDGRTAGLYRGDRDSFVLMIDGGSIVTDPSAQLNEGQMYRGVMIRNSEVGACSITIECVLFRYICGNLIIWGATISRSFRRRHVGKSQNVLRDVMAELETVARRWTHRPASQDETLIKALIAHEIATTRDAVIDELKAMGATAEQAKTAYDTCERTETRLSPRSYWGIAQGLTRDSQATPYQDERYELDKLAAVVLARGAKLVAA